MDKAFLIILDGWGHGKEPNSSAIAQASTPYIDSLYKEHPHAELVTYGDEVGLPSGQMGNSEVGHLNIGAGRIVFQTLAQINNDIKADTLKDNIELQKLLELSLKANSKLHLIGLVSDGGVHSHINHLKALIDIIDSKGVDSTFVHAFLDGRDTDPKSGLGYIDELERHIGDKESVNLGTIIGRYYAMDRDNRWERTKKAYDLLTQNIGDYNSKNPTSIIQSRYDEGVTDEFMEGIIVSDSRIEDGDTVLFFNFRTDRPRQLTDVLTQRDLEDHKMHKLDLDFFTMTEYDQSFNGINVLYKKEPLKNTIGEVLAQNNLKQLRIAETEKYPHVTFFFSGGHENEFRNESRILVNSPKVATYDLKPEMSAFELTDNVIRHLEQESPDFIVLNYANADMVGHTGDFEAAKMAAQVLDNCLSVLVPKASQSNYSIVIIADHGNSDFMINEDGSPHTAHTTNPVPIIVIKANGDVQNVQNGKLADIAPTILHLMGVGIPSEMTGNILID